MSRTTVRTPSIEFARRGSAPEADGDVVRRRGVIFRAGDYSASHDFTMTPAELKALAATFKGPIKIDHGHPTTDGPIDFGALESVEASDDGTTLYGTTATPAWLNKALGDARWLVSASIDRATKAIRRLSLVTRPHISGAELQAAFACSCGGDDPVTKEEPPMADDNDRLARCRALVDEMTDEDRAVMLGEDEPDPETTDEPDDDEPTPAEFAARDARIEELEAKDRRRDAEVFVEAAIKDELALPAERAGLIARHANFALIEKTLREAPELVNFSAGKTPGLVADFEADVRARKPHGHTKEHVSFGHVLSNGGGAPEEDEAAKRKRLDARLANTSTGRGILARRNGNA